MRTLWAALVAMVSPALLPGTAIPKPVHHVEISNGIEPAPVCTQDGNVDSCWQAAVAAEKRGDAGAALAAYEASCSASFQLGGCYEAGKIYFLNPKLRDYDKSAERMTQVCESADVGIGPYACKYLGIIYRKGLSGPPQIDRAFASLSRSCFPHTDEPFIDGNGCEILADSVPGADEMGVAEEVWQPDYVAYMAYAMGCSDNMPSLCDRARTIHRRAVANSASWLARCAEDARAVEFSRGCEDVTRSASVADYEQRQAFRRRLVGMYHRATDYAG